MARTPGTYTLAGTLELQADAPADARLLVKTKADLTSVSSFPYKYVGMIVSVESEQKAYMLIDADTTQVSSWKDMGEGGGSSTLAGLTDVNLDTPTEGQILVYDAENEEWVNSSATGGSLGTDITSSVAAGGIPAGTTYEAGTAYDKLWKDLLNPVAYPTLTNPSATLTATGAKLLEKGSTLATTMTVAFSRGSINPAYSTSGYRSGVALDYALNGGTAQVGNTFSVTVDESQLTYQATVNYAAGEQPKDSEGNDYDSPLAAGSVNSNTLSYEFTDAMWSNVANIATIAKMSLVSKSAKQRDMNFGAQTVANPETFDVPVSWTVTAIQVKNDLSGVYEDASAQFTVTDTTHDDAAGTSVAYKRYTFNLGYDTGARSVRLKWS